MQDKTASSNHKTLHFHINLVLELALALQQATAS